MRLMNAVAALESADAQNVYLYTVRDLEKVFNEVGDAFRSTLRRCLAARVLQRIARGLYAYPRSRNISPTTLYDIAARLRRGEYAFEALESAANQWGIFTQVPLGGVTLLTTGRSGRFNTPYGSIEFVHTEASPSEINANVVERPGNPIPLATKEYTAKTLRRHRRSNDLMIESALMERGEHGAN